MAWPKEKPDDRYPSDLTDEEWEIIKPILETDLECRACLSGFESINAATNSQKKSIISRVLNGLFG